MAERTTVVAQAGAWRGLHGGMRLLNSPYGAAALALVAYGAFALVRLALLGGDVSRFIMAGPQFISPQMGASVGLSVLPHGLGYDGQFYYLLALNPFSPHAALPGAHFDVPAYRAQRIFYPLVVWAFSLGGRPGLTPTVMVLVNLAAIAAIGACSALLARRCGVAPLWGALVALYPGLLVSLAGDLGEPLALACLLGALLCVSYQRWGWAALLFSLAVLSRETTALVPLALLATLALVRFMPLAAAWLRVRRVIPREQWRRALVAGLTPLLVAGGWQAVLWARWGEIGALAHGTSNAALPFIGLIESLAIWGILGRPWLQITLYASALYLVVLFEMTRRALRREPSAHALIAVAWGLYATLLVILSVSVWDLSWNFLRAASEFGVLSLLLLAMAASPRVRWIALGATAVIWVMTFFALAGATAPSL